MTGKRIVCHECGRQHHYQVLPQNAAARCSRCGYLLYRHRPPTFERALALTLAGVVLFLLANAFPFIGIDMAGNITQTTLISGAVEMYREGKWMLSIVVLFTSVIAPGLQLGFLLYLLLPLHMGRIPPDLPRVFRFVNHLLPWSMMDVFLLGIFVSTVKLADFGSIIPGLALGAFLLLILVLAAAQAAIDPDRIWSLVPVAETHKASQVQGEPMSCPTCHLSVAPLVEPGRTLRCPRCYSALHHRKPESLQRTWAFLIAAMVCYIPANLLPIMHTTTLQVTQSDTIMSGVIYLYAHGMWPLALIVFVASVFVPMLKILILVYLLLSVHFRSRARMVDRTRLYRITESIGRWSMVDVYVVTVLVSMVQMGGLASIEAGWGAVFFSAVVILTMFAAMAFDPRLIWDAEVTEEGFHARVAG
jgi:paraquat-inducible protein A